MFTPVMSSLMATEPLPSQSPTHGTVAGVLVAVGAGVMVMWVDGVAVAVPVGASVAVGLWICVGVTDSVDVTPAVSVALAIAVGVTVPVGASVTVAVLGSDGVAVAVGEGARH
jgi:hypothetical protein